MVLNHGEVKGLIVKDPSLIPHRNNISGQRGFETTSFRARVLRATSYTCGTTSLPWCVFISTFIYEMWLILENEWIGSLTSHSTIFQLYMWRHIDVQANCRSWTYSRAILRKPCDFSRHLRRAWEYGGYILVLNSEIMNCPGVRGSVVERSHRGY